MKHSHGILLGREKKICLVSINRRERTYKHRKCLERVFKMLFIVAYREGYYGRGRKKTFNCILFCTVCI